MTTAMNLINSQTIAHIGGMNLLAISGGRIFIMDKTTVMLPVRHGYRVIVHYNEALDLYDVERVLIRKGQVTVKGTEASLYADQVGDSAYRASCYSDPFGEG